VPEVDKLAAIDGLPEETLARLADFAEKVLRKMSQENFQLVQSGRDFVQTAVLKALNAEHALMNGDAAIINGRVQLTVRARSEASRAERYAAGLRFWNPMQHDLEGFLKLVILSDIRAAAKRLKHGPTIKSTEELAGLESEKSLAVADTSALEASLAESFLNSLDSDELRLVGQRLLVNHESIEDLMFELGLTRSQVEKRVRKLMEAATHFAGSQN